MISKEKTLHLYDRLQILNFLGLMRIDPELTKGLHFHNQINWDIRTCVACDDKQHKHFYMTTMFSISERGHWDTMMRQLHSH